MQTFLRLGLAVAALSSAVATVPALAADAYPNKPVQMLIGFPPGSATDFVGRLIAPKLAERLGQPVVVENRPGAAGVLATASFAKAKPDGYSIMVSIPGPITIAPITQKGNLTYSPEKDLTPVVLIGGSPLLVTVKSDSGIRSVAELKAKAESLRDGMSVASYGVGSPSHFAVEMLRVQGGLPITHIPFNGSAALQTALLGGVVPAAVDSVTAGLPLVRDGRVSPLAVTAAERLESLPDVPTTKEAGLGPMQLGGWAGIHVPAGTPPEIVARLNKEVNAVLALPEVQAQMKDRLVIVGGTPEAFAEHIRAETERLADVANAAKMQFQ